MMDISESLKVLYKRIQKLDPDNVTKVIGNLLLQDNGEEKIISLANLPNHSLEKVVYNAHGLQRLLNKMTIAPISPPLNPPHAFSHLPADSPGSFQVPSPPNWNPQLGRNAKSALGHMDSNIGYLNQREVAKTRMFGSPKSMEYQSVNYDQGQIVNEKIFLRFPAESTFTKEDVSNYFSDFGPIKDVRIPKKEQRVYGFVTFTNSDTVNSIFQMGNPHLIQGYPVSVKPFRDYTLTPADRKHKEKIEYPGYVSPHYEAFGGLRIQLYEEQEFQRKSFTALQLAQNPVVNPPHTDYSLYGLKSDHPYFQSTKRFSDGLDDKTRNAGTSHIDQESDQELHLPDDPFGSP
ncbi:zinc finger CCCH domain-containing protein 18 [Quillaja saponaria]|uniref:Zinc finger CCCH domain-containing protein 18 n=1 Tax=Quillaja saponaria TaxID=32244 RepID=A0AAD7LT24_QUISA|nr:zinc finger CCCH domain-containing protein 18 [Quillaja saponaria]